MPAKYIFPRVPKIQVAFRVEKETKDKLIQLAKQQGVKEAIVARTAIKLYIEKNLKQDVKNIRTS